MSRIRPGRAAPRRRRCERGAEPRGFVLLSVLLVIGVVSALALAATAAVRRQRADAAAELRRVEASALVDAGLNRAIAALEGPSDPLRDVLLSKGPSVRWTFAGQTVFVSLVPETGKVDLNSGDPELVANLLRAVVRDRAKSDRLVARLAAWRRAGRDLDTVRGLLDPEDRIGPLARGFEAVFTVWTGVRGVSLEHAPPAVLRSLPGLGPGEVALLAQARTRAELAPIAVRYGSLLDASRPIYRARAEATVAGGVTVRREALLALNSAARRVSVVFWRDVVE